MQETGCSKMKVWILRRDKISLHNVLIFGYSLSSSNPKNETVAGGEDREEASLERGQEWISSET